MADIDRVAAYLDSLWLERGLSDNTLSAYRRDLTAWVTWLQNRGTSLAVFVVSDVLDYMAQAQRDGLSIRTLARRLSAVRGLTLFLIATGVRQDDPTADVPAPSLPKALPKTLSESDVESLLMVANPDTRVGLRDRAALEVLYASGIRVSELVGLRITTLDRETGLVRVVGKGNKERLVPLGEECLYWVDRFIAEARPGMPGASQSDFLFPGRNGPMTRQTLWHRIKKLAAQANLPADLSPHALRHAFATHLLNHGVDLRSVQLMLGHADLSTTQIYTHVATARLQNLHRQHHPRNAKEPHS